MGHASEVFMAGGDWWMTQFVGLISNERDYNSRFVKTVAGGVDTWEVASDILFFNGLDDIKQIVTLVHVFVDIHWVLRVIAKEQLCFADSQSSQTL